MSEEIIGTCHECGEPCTERDLVGNQVELGFPVLWCDKCINRAFEKYEESKNVAQD